MPQIIFPVLNSELDQEEIIVPKIPVSIAEPVHVDEEGINQLLLRGNIKCGANAVKRLAKLGVPVIGAGVLKLTSGGVILSQSRASEATGLICAAMEALSRSDARDRLSQMLNLAQSAGYLISRLNGNYKSQLKMTEYLGHQYGYLP
jgi:hypothetical protein